MSNIKLLEEGIASVKAGELDHASVLLSQFLQLEPDSELGWLWMGMCRVVTKEREYCFQRVLKINPANVDAKAELEKLSYPASSSPSSSKKESETCEPSTTQAPPHIKNKSNYLSAIIGLLLGLLCCGVPLISFAASDSLSRANGLSLPFLFTPTKTGTRTPIPPTLTATPSLDYQARFALADPYISEALEMSAKNKTAEAITAWTQAIVYVPDFAEAYYQRGICYLLLMDNQRYESEYYSYLELALSDFNSAISLNPQNGDYYVERYIVFELLALSQESRIDMQTYETLGLENLELALFYGTANELTERYYVAALTMLGRCDEAQRLAKQLLAEYEQPSAGLNAILAKTYACQGNLSTALEYINEAVLIRDLKDHRYVQYTLLIGLGKLDDAKILLDESISIEPYYYGNRYYLRALIYALQGDTDHAQEDLDFGSGQTWNHSGLFYYVSGKISEVNGDTEEALNYYQLAESSYLQTDAIYFMILEDLEKLGGSPLIVTPIPIEATHIPTLTPSLTPRPTSSRAPIFTPIGTPTPPPHYADIIDLEQGIVNPIIIQPLYEAIFQFQPAEAIPYQDVLSLSVWFSSTEHTGLLPLTVELWDIRFSSWGEDIENLHWGENPIDYPYPYIFPDGDIYLHILNDGMTAIRIDKITIFITVRNDDGTISTYGTTP